MSLRPSDEQIRAAAAAWLARGDRGLTAAEALEFSRWQSANPQHAHQYRELRAAWIRWDTARAAPEWQAYAQRLEGRIQLTAAARRRRCGIGLAAAAVLAAACWVGLQSSMNAPQPRPAVTLGESQAHFRIIPGAARTQKLPDGSLAELREGSEIAVAFTSRERRVQLIRGEVNFNVAKEPSRPFLVAAGGLIVQAVGTAFDLKVSDQAINVLVTEGRVRVDDAERRKSTLPASDHGILQAGRRAHIARNGGRVSVDSATVCPVSPEEIDRTLDWLSTRLIFSGTRLADAVAIFNRYAADRGGLKLVLDQPALGEKRLGGSFRVDNVEGFVRLLERSSNIQSARRGAAELVLTAASRPER